MSHFPDSSATTADGAGPSDSGAAGTTGTERTGGATAPAAVPATLDGITLEAILVSLVARYGWEDLGRRIELRCFTHDPSIRSSLKFLRKTPWARQKVEQLYLQSGA